MALSTPHRPPSWFGQASVALFGLLTFSAWLAGVHAVFELVANGRVYLFLGGVVMVLAALAARRGGIALVAAVVAAANLLCVIPYWMPSPDIGGEDTAVAQVLQYNIWFGNDDMEAVAERIVLADADVVALHELTDGQWEALEPLLVDHPHRLARPVSDDIGQLGGGMAVLSKSPLREVAVDPSADLPERPLLAVETAILGETVTIVGLHPHASRFSSAKVALRNAQISATVDLLNARGGPAIVLTDLNVTPTSPVYKDFIDDLGWRDPHKLVGWKATWPSPANFMGMPIDHVLVSNDFALHRYRIMDGAGSDHRALVAQISLAE